MLPLANHWPVHIELHNDLLEHILILGSRILFIRTQELIFIELVHLEPLGRALGSLVDILSIFTVLALVEIGAVKCLVGIVIVASLFRHPLGNELVQDLAHADFGVVLTGEGLGLVSAIDDHLRGENHLGELVLFQLVELSCH